MHHTSKLAFANIGQLIIDVIFLVVSFIISYFIKIEFSRLNDIKNYVWFLILYIPIWLLIMNTLKMYDRTTFNYKDRIFKNILISSLLSGVLLAAVIFYIKDTMFSRMLYIIFIYVSTLLLTLERYIYFFYIKRIIGSSDVQVIIIGEKGIAEKLEKYLSMTDLNINILGYVHLPFTTNLSEHRNLGDITELENILKNNVIDEVIFALQKDYMDEVEKYILLCEKMGVTVRVILKLFDLKLSKVYLSSIGNLPMLTFHTVFINSFQRFVKRTIDIIGASVGLAFTGLIFPFVFAAIKIDSPGPTLFTQERVGLNGRRFKIYKFRTMYIDAEERKAELMHQNQVTGGLMFKVKSDPRITKVGRFLRKTSIDEFPQFINVLKGDMSLIGTRPPTLDEVCNYDLHHFRRISIKPGITGLWQVSGRSQITDFEKVVKLDTQYIDNWNLWLDVKIMLKTLAAVFNSKGAM